MVGAGTCGGSLTVEHTAVFGISAAAAIKLPTKVVALTTHGGANCGANITDRLWILSLHKIGEYCISLLYRKFDLGSHVAS